MVLPGTHTSSSALVAFLVAANAAYAQSATQAAPGQPQRSGTVGTFDVVGNSIVSAQQVRTLHSTLFYLI